MTWLSGLMTTTALLALCLAGSGQVLGNAPAACTDMASCAKVYWDYPVQNEGKPHPDCQLLSKDSNNHYYCRPGKTTGFGGRPEEVSKVYLDLAPHYRVTFTSFWNDTSTRQYAYKESQVYYSQYFTLENGKGCSQGDVTKRCISLVVKNELPDPLPLNTPWATVLSKSQQHPDTVQEFLNKNPGYLNVQP
ncbi:MAG: hypothetical protein DHS80DRAFT_24814 [Piptocephalis tieghemiana]|nr:MAG: hypothetical protein DHS80DRAFT_24814 [Piptocephalis tieghemiana]